VQTKKLNQMKKIFYLLLVLSFVFTSCKKEEGCMDTMATNYNADAEEDDGSCLFSVAGGTWTTQSIASNGTMTVSMMGIPILDSTISYIETNADSLEPYKLKFDENNTYTEYDQSNSIVEGGTWSLSGDQLTVNSPDTSLVLTVNSVNKSDASLNIVFVESSSEDGFEYSIDLTQTINLTREY